MKISKETKQHLLYAIDKYVEDNEDTIDMSEAYVLLSQVEVEE